MAKTLSFAAYLHVSFVTEQKKQELEKWKRRASYDPRKAAALGKTTKVPAKTAK